MLKTITLHGCDDWNEITLEITVEELSAYRKLMRAVNKNSTSQCQPTITIEKVK